MIGILELFRILRKANIMPFKMEIEEMPEGSSIEMVSERAREVNGLALILPARAGVVPKKAWILKNRRTEGYYKKEK